MTNMNWTEVENSILAQFSDGTTRKDYRGMLIDQQHVRHYLTQAKNRIGLIVDKVQTYAPPPASVLEVGASYGMALLSLQSVGYQIHGADLQSSLDTYSHALRAADVPLTAWDLHRDPPFSEPQFDVIIASEVLEHLQMSLKAATKQLASALKPGGYLFITTPNIYQLPYVIRILRGQNINEPFPDEPVIQNNVVIDNRTHPREPTMKELRHAIVANELELVESRYFVSRRRSPLKQFLMKAAPPVFRSHLLVIGRKGEA